MVDQGALAAMPIDDLEAYLSQLVEHRRYNKLEFWQPYAKQREFIAAGKTHKERLLSAGNQLGKSEVGGDEVATHLTGLYPADWPGRVFDKPNDWWAAGVSTTVVRDVQQTKLCGEPGVDELLGTGFIPRHCFVGKPTLARGAVANSYDTCQVRHFRISHQARDNDPTDDGISTLQFKSYEQGRQKFQGKTLTGGVWWDEEPDEDVYTEGNARWSATDGMSLMTFTPLKGQSKVVMKFTRERSPLRTMVKFRATECPHMTPERIIEIKNKYPEHEWEARLNGEPKLGAGAIFRTKEEIYRYPVAKMIPEHWPLIWGIDFGFNHPFAAVLAAVDRDLDTIYILHALKVSETLPIVQVAAMRNVCADAPVAYPHDGNRRDGMNSGEAIAKTYRDLGLKMLPEHATFTDGSLSTEKAVFEMQQRLEDGRLKVREDLEDILVEFRSYHRDEDGLLVKLYDDLISAIMKIMMMKRYARVVEMGWKPLPNLRAMKRGRPTHAAILNPWTGRPANRS